MVIGYEMPSALAARGQKEGRFLSFLHCHISCSYSEPFFLFIFFTVCNKSGDTKCTFKHTRFSSLCTMTENKENYDTITLTRGPSTGGNTHVIKTNVERLATRGRYILMI